MFRCKACNARITKFEIVPIKDSDKFEIEDLCVKCRVIVKNADNLKTHEYAFEHITDDWEDFTKYRE